MIGRAVMAGLLCLSALVVGCDSTEKSAAVPDPVELAGDEIGYYCNMIVTSHAGPKGQVLLTDRARPLWFTSARDTIAFTMLPEEPKNISAVYVSDMGRASWDHPEPGTWVEARQAWYVVGSGRVGGMGAPEPVPFADKHKAEAFQAEHGGRVLSFADIPREEILGFDAAGLDRATMLKPGESM